MTQAAALWTRYTQTKATQDRAELIELHAPLAKFVVDRLHLALPPSMSQEDLIGQAVIGLIEAIDSYDPSRGVKFETFAYHRIRGAVMDMLREMDWLPRTLRRKERALSSTAAEMEKLLGRAPSEAELAAEMDLSLEELAQLNSSLRLQAIQSLHEVVANGDGDLVEAMEVVADEEAANPDFCLEEKEDKRLLIAAIEGLPEKEKLVVGLYYQEELTLKEIAAVLGVTESWVCQLHARALLKLREELVVK
jgi:RNA polymerase sigma factor for flagellar operon FliA